MVIRAKYSSRCPRCGGYIIAGDEIEWRHYWKRGEKAIHVKCPEKQASSGASPKKTGQLWEPCPRCGHEPVYMPLHLCGNCWPTKPVTPQIDTTSPEPYRRGIGQGFGSGGDY